MTVITLKLPESLAQRVSAEAARRHTTKSGILRACIEQVLVGARRSGAGSFHERARDLCGACRGPEDLSSNPAFLEKYGR